MWLLIFFPIFLIFVGNSFAVPLQEAEEVLQIVVKQDDHQKIQNELYRYDVVQSSERISSSADENNENPTGEDKKKLIQDLEAYIQTFNAVSFEGDEILEQQIDHLNGLTIYKLPFPGKKGRTIYYHNSNDKGKHVIVLEETPAHKLIAKEGQSLFVGLKKKGLGSNLYYVFYIYVRDGTKDDYPLTTLGGKLKMVEFDFWNDRQAAFHRDEWIHDIYGTSSCSPSILIPCKTTQKIALPPGASPLLKYNVPKPNPFHVWTKKETPQTFQTEEGYQVDRQYLFFEDFRHETKQQIGAEVSLDVKALEVAIPSAMKNLKKFGLYQKPSFIYVQQHGWKITGNSIRPHESFYQESQPFVGFGICPYKPITKQDWENAQSGEDIIFLMAIALKTYCIKNEVQLYNNLLKEGLLVYDEKEKVLEVDECSDLLDQDKIGKDLAISYSRAVQLSVLSVAYHEELYDEDNLHHDCGCTQSITRRVYTLGKALIAGIRIARTSSHQIGLLRAFALTANMAFLKLVQDQQIINECGSACAEDSLQNKNDQFYLMGIVQFIINGLDPVFNGQKTPAEALESFNELNWEIIEEIVESYY